MKYSQVVNKIQIRLKFFGMFSTVETPNKTTEIENDILTSSIESRLKPTHFGMIHAYNIETWTVPRHGPTPGPKNIKINKTINKAIQFKFEDLTSCWI